MKHFGFHSHIKKSVNLLILLSKGKITNFFMVLLNFLFYWQCSLMFSRLKETV